MGGPVRAQVLWVPAGPRLPRRDRVDLQLTLRGKSRRVWILDADLAGAFDKIGHEHLLEVIGGLPCEGDDRRVA